jgi:hypothetical protein
MHSLDEHDLIEICTLAAKGRRLLSTTLMDWLHTNGWHELAVRCAVALTEPGEYTEPDPQLDGTAELPPLDYFCADCEAFWVFLSKNRCPKCGGFRIYKR